MNLTNKYLSRTVGMPSETIEDDASVDTEEASDSRLSKLIDMGAQGTLNVLEVAIKGALTLNNTMEQFRDIFGRPVTHDDGQEQTVVTDRVGDLSLRYETIDAYKKWKPAARYLKSVENENFDEMANLIDRIFLQGCEWFGRMWYVWRAG